ncbi:MULTISPECIES: alpha-ketoglutarate-dependent dioxygenase AlkB [unclassified Acinetobacter]|uniref:alpha-ketoglutarate-dependent dioxygenase AlkB family protein n=1 Tax=unclassified Acinetobacter TaxID=196816 RepID=UPI0029351E7B|nr:MULTISPECIES: alpha-ketoglutarate-dependent dioxygenase AlkB [unclassified Acinetobacter]WOE31488.1 alpha-ketoglutarate-dependent dioxygenase AlkB [Acinetobacter sp. SAAs470]WOE39684.1 alpha-ketoglutarate-dependent dioxygenase AlkB [Acinetobacter sp. SAAs474]
MDLFKQHNQLENLLPDDGHALYFGPILSGLQADRYFQSLLQSIAWQHDEAIIYGKHIITKRQVAWYGDQPFGYTYSRITKHALAWTPALLELKHIVEQVTHEKFNSCLLNLYHDGQQAMSWHSDAEIDLRKNGTIASLSLGAERKFVFKHKVSKEKIELWLAHGSLLVMKGLTQTHWLHCLAPSKRITTARINLTFRQMNNKNSLSHQ